MTWLDCMNKSLEYIESNLDSEIDTNEIAKIACCSTTSFQRVFSIITDIPLSKYIRQRRLTLAAFELQNTKIKIIDLALKYGYESPEAFTRAFSIIHGIPPTVARSKGVSLKAYPRISFLLTIKGDIAMDYRIEKKEAFSVYGLEKICSTDDDKNLIEIPQFWQDTMNDGRFDKLFKSTNINPNSDNCICAINAICGYKETGDNTFPYMLFSYRTDKSNSDGYTVLDVPAATWAVFKADFPSKEVTSGVIQNLNKRIYTDWLPTANYEKIDGYELELYFDNYVETWIRVVPK